MAPHLNFENVVGKFLVKQNALMYTIYTIIMATTCETLSKQWKILQLKDYDLQKLTNLINHTASTYTHTISSLIPYK